MTERIVLSEPDTGPTRTEIVVVGTEEYYDSQGRVDPMLCVLVADDASTTVRRHYWRGQEAIPILRALDKANLSVKSKRRRLLELLIAEGREGDGQVVGEPE